MNIRLTDEEWRAHRQRALSEALYTAAEELHEDNDLAWDYHCRVAAGIVDENVHYSVANRAAARVMQALFSVDTWSLIPKYTVPEPQHTNQEETTMPEQPGTPIHEKIYDALETAMASYRGEPYVSDSTAEPPPDSQPGSCGCGCGCSPPSKGSRTADGNEFASPGYTGDPEPAYNVYPCPPPEPPLYYQYGWLCGRCGASNAPSVQQCPSCTPPVQVTCCLNTPA